MREKVLSLAKGNFIYESPELIVTPAKLIFDVTAGGKKTVNFLLENKRGSVIKGFGSTDDFRVNFLPVFRAEKNELSMEFDATELTDGTKVSGQLYLVTDCGEITLPYEGRVVAPVLEDDKGVIKDYAALRQRVETDSKKAAAIFHSPSFSECFLYRNEAAKVLYRHLVRKNSKRQSMEEFLVAMGKKEPVRLSLRFFSGDRNRANTKMAKNSIRNYELSGEDLEDTVQIRVNTWGSIGVHIDATADFIVPEVTSIRTDEFENRAYNLRFIICKDKVRGCKKEGSLIFSTLYEKKEIKIYVSDRTGERDRRERRDERRQFAVLYRAFLSWQEGRCSTEEFCALLWEKKDLLSKICQGYEIPLAGYLNVLKKDEGQILDFYREAEAMQMPKSGEQSRDVKCYLLVQYVKYLLSGREEERETVSSVLTSYEEQGYGGLLFFLIHLQVDERYKTWKWKEEDIRAQIRQGSASPLLYSEMNRIYREDASLISSLDPEILAVLSYGIRHDLVTSDMSIAVSIMTNRMVSWNPLIFSLLTKFYEKYGQIDTLKSICGMLIRAQKREEKYFRWFALGIKARLRMTELYEYYMYTMDYKATFRLPDTVLSYFQYENHLNDRCKAFLYAYIVKKKAERPDVYDIYAPAIYAFAVRQLSHHRVTEDICTLYEELFQPGVMARSVLPSEQLAKDLSHVMFEHTLLCDNPRIDSVVVVHEQTKEEVLYPLENKRAVIQLYTPDYQLYFVNREGHYLSGTVSYSLKKMLHLDELAEWCREQGSEYVPLLIHLTAKAMRSIRLSEDQAAMMHRVMQMECLRSYVQEKLLLCLYDYYSEKREMTQLLEILQLISTEHMKKSRIGKLAEDCISHGLFDKAYQMLLRYGTAGCNKKALETLVSHQLDRHKGEFDPVLVKCSYELYREKVYSHDILQYLLQYYMGRTAVLAAIYKNCAGQEVSLIPDGSKERLLGQVLFTGKNPSDYENLFLDYYENGTNRMLVKAFLSYYAYEFLVGHVKKLSESVFVKIEKEAFYVKDRVMVLATLKRYSAESNFAKKQQEFIEKNLEECAVRGLVLDFMKDFVGKVTVPYEIENRMLIQYNSGTVKEVFLHITEEDGNKVVVPMKKVFDGIFTTQILLFYGDEKTYYIEEEESGIRTENKVLRQSPRDKSSPGLFWLVNQMAKTWEEFEKTNDVKIQKEYESLRRQYEMNCAVAKQLFSVEDSNTP